MSVVKDLIDLAVEHFAPEIYPLGEFELQAPKVKAHPVNQIPPAKTINVGDFAIIKTSEINDPEFLLSTPGIYICRENNQQEITNIPADRRSLVELEYWNFIYETVIKKPNQQNSESRKSLFLLHKLYPYQIVGVNFLMNNDSALLADDMGLGKALSMDALILTPAGWKEMRDIQVGDEIINTQGAVSHVTGVYPQGIQPMYRVTFSDGASVNCTADHLWAVKDSLLDNDWQVKTLAAIAYRFEHSRPYIPTIILPNGSPATLSGTNIRRFSSIEYIGQQEAQCIAVDAPDSLFITNDYIVTHNTVTTTVAMKLLLRRGLRKRVLIVCPVSVLYVWMKHLQEWAPELVFQIVRGDRKTRRKLWRTPAHVYLTSYPTLRIDVLARVLPESRLKMFDLVVLDEAHAIKNFDAKQSKAVKMLSAAQRWALTGTPIQNKVDDLVSLFDFLKPGYIRPEYKDDKALVRSMAQPYMLRRRKDVELVGQLPERNEQVNIWLDLDDDQKIEYAKILAQCQKDLARQGDKVSYVSILGALTLLKQVCNAASGKDTSPKIVRLKEQIEEITAGGNKCVVFSQFIQRGIKLLQPALRQYGVCTLVGGMSDDERRMQIERFKRKGNNVMLVSLRAGGEGLTLTEANYVIHFDSWWNPAAQWQATDRVYRIGQQKMVSEYVYWMNDTIEEKIYAILQEKGLLFREMIDELSSKNATKLISKQEWLKIFGVRK